MAKSNSFFSIRRGSTKSHTYSGWQGQQVTKDRVVNVKNPRSAAQQEQRQKFTAVGNFYKYLKFILNHSWEGVSYGVNSYNRFMSINVKGFDATKMIIPQYGSKVAEAGAYQVSEGSLPAPFMSWDGRNPIITGVENDKPGVGAPTVATLKKLFANGEDYITLVGLISTAQPDGSPNVNYQTSGFAMRLHYPTAADTTEVTTDNLFTLLEAEYVGGVNADDFSAEIEAGTAENPASVTINFNNNSKYPLCFTIIGSKRDSNSSSAVLRSTSILRLSETVAELVAATNASNAESWPVGADYLLNGGHVEPTVG